MYQYTAHDPPARTVEALSLAQLMRDGSWRLDLAHDRPDHLLIWITRGQGVGLIDGARRGLGLHNALLIPARMLFALDLNRQVFGQAVVIPEGIAPSLPDSLHHLRIRDVSAQAELTALFEALGREQSGDRSMKQAAMAAHVELMSIWLHRQIEAGLHPKSDMIAPTAVAHSPTMTMNSPMYRSEKLRTYSFHWYGSR